MAFIDSILQKLAVLIREGRYAELESDGLEIKPVPAIGNEWQRIHESVNAFLNTRGGILLLGVKEVFVGGAKQYELTGWRENAEPNLKEFPRLFTDREGHTQDLVDCFPPQQIREINGQRVAIVYVDELSADRKFVFYKGVAYVRRLTGDHKISESEIESQEEFKEEAANARELRPLGDLTIADLDLAKLNQFIFQLNQPVQLETIKADLEQAQPFLERKHFLSNGRVTILGALVCAKNPGDCLGFRSHVHGYVDTQKVADVPGEPEAVVEDKQDYVDNVLQLMSSSLGYLQRNIRVGVGLAEGGQRTPQYPDALLRETVNNALAHRDYAIDRQVILAISPGKHIAIQNPGRFRHRLLIEDPDAAIPVRRIIPEAKPRNPKLADVLRVFRKWEGRGIGMATLVNLCLQDQMDLPFYRLRLDEVCLYLCTGRLLDERMQRMFQSFDGYIEGRLQGRSFTNEHKLVLSYLIKSEWANRRWEYTILLTPDNNHFDALRELEQFGLIQKHSCSTSTYPVYVCDRTLVETDYWPQLKEIFGSSLDYLPKLHRDLLSIAYRFNHFNKLNAVSAKQAAFTLWYESGERSGGIEQFDSFYRKIRNAFNRLKNGNYLIKEPKSRGYTINRDYLKSALL